MMNGRAWIIIVPKDSPAKTIYDLKGKKISCGIRTGEGAFFLDYIRLLGLSKDDFKLFFIGKGEGIEAYKNGSVDAITCVSVIPSSMFSQAAENLIKNHGFPIHSGTERFLKELKLEEVK
jgi:sulfonate transport system substrate-binding protein